MVVVERPANVEEGEPSAQILRWQERLLPFTTRFMVGLAIVFLVFTIYELIEARSMILADDTAEIRTAVQGQIARASTGGVTAAQSFQHSLLLLEADVLDRRYHQASALLMSRIWMKHLAFMTGMAMSFLGALFILGKFRESSSAIQLDASPIKAAVSSASPGIILSFLGAVLLVVSLVVQTTIAVHDAPVYVHGMGLAPASANEVGARTALPELGPPPDVIDLGSRPRAEPKAHGAEGERK
jgi:hypothetical protein